eukprot:818418_1
MCMGHNNAIMNLLYRILFMASFQVVQSRVLPQLTQEDYTLYFDEYRFDWSNTDDWNIIPPQNTPYSEIIACTLPIQVIKKNVCVQTKSEGGFTLTFDDIPNSNSNASYIDESNDFESFLRSDDDIYNIELDYLNDDHWNEISTIWNWNTQQNQQQMNENKMYQSLQNNMRRRLGEEEEDMFLGGLFGRKKKNQNRVPRMRQRHHHKISPMMRMMMQMMQMQMMMKMMKGLMPHPHGGCGQQAGGCAKVAQSGDYLYDYDAFYNANQDDDRTDNALYNAYADLYDDLYDDDDAFRRVRRLTGYRRRSGGGFQNMVSKIPDMMMQMAMMKSMGEIMRTMNPYIAMMMLHHMKSPQRNGRNGGAHCASTCRPGSPCNCRPRGMGGMGGMNHLPMPMMGGMMPNQYMMNPSMMHLGMPGMMNPMMMGMNPMMGMGGMGMQGMNGGQTSETGHAKAVKKCRPLQNGLEICTTYDKTSNHLVVDVKCKNCKKKKTKGKSNRPFPEQMSKMVKTLVKQRVFGNAAAQGDGAYAAPKPKGGKGAKAPKPKAAKGPAGKGVGDQSMGKTGVGMQGMKAMEGAAAAHEEDMWRRMMMMDDEHWVQFDTMEGNLGYGIWRAEYMDWHSFGDYDALGDADQLMEYGEYRNFGNFVHYFDTLEFDWNDADDWSDVDGIYPKSMIQFGDDPVQMNLGQKCGHKLPFLDFKLCSKVQDHDISVFFKRTASENTYAADTAYDDNNYVDSDYFDIDEKEYEWNDVQTLRDIIDYEFENSLFRFNNDEDWHEITSSYLQHHNRRHLMENERVISSGSRLGEHDHGQTEIELFGHLYRLKGISKCGGDADNPTFCVGVHLGQPIVLPRTIQLPLTKMCNFMFIAKVCLGFDPNQMELKLSIQFQSIHKWKSVAKRILDVIKHIPYKTKRYVQWARTASMDLTSAKQMDGDVYEEDEQDIMDQWHEDDSSVWVVSSSAKVSADDVYWDDDEIWDDVSTVKTDNGHEVRRKCMQNMGGRRLCFCQFMSWIDAQRYDCHRTEPMKEESTVASSAKGLDMDRYLDVYYDYDANAIVDDDDDGPMNAFDMSLYYDVIGPQIKWDDNEANDDVFDAIVDENDDILYDDEDEEEEIELYDEMDSNFNAMYDELEHELNTINNHFNAKALYDADYDSVNKEYAYDYEYYFGDKEWTQHEDDPKELKRLQHPQQEEHNNRDLFVYNDYNDDISYEVRQKKSDEDDASDESIPSTFNGIGFNINSLIEINPNLFWFLSVLAVFFGICLCSLVLYYTKKRRQFVKEFGNQFHQFASLSPTYDMKPLKYGFTPVNVPISHWNSDSDESNTNEDDNIDEIINQCMKEESDASKSQSVV